MIHFGWKNPKYTSEPSYLPTIGFDKSVCLGTHHFLQGEVESSDIPDVLQSDVSPGDEFVFRADQLTGIDEPSSVQLDVNRPGASKSKVLIASSQIPIDYAQMVGDLLGRAKVECAQQLSVDNATSFLDAAFQAFQTRFQQAESSSR